MPLSTAQLNKYLEQNGINNRKLAVKNLIDVYKDDWDGIILDELAKQFNKLNAKTLRPLITKELNLIKKITNETALVYKTPAMRTAIVGEVVEGEEPKIDENYEE